MRSPEKNGPERTVYRGKIIEVVEQPMKIADKDVIYESARRAPGTRLIVVSKDGSRMLLSKEYRTELQGYDYRLPGGKVFDTLHEYNDFLETGADIQPQAQKAAAKEALEEVGIDVKSLELFGISKCGATIEWDLYYFVVQEYTEVARRDSGEGEDITATWFDTTEIKAMCYDGRIQEDRTALMLLRYYHV